MNIKEIRYKNARSLIDTCGSLILFSEKIDRTPSQASSFAGKKPRKGIGDEMALHIESSFGLPRGWMDKEHIGLSDIPYSGATPEQTHEQITDKYQLLAQLAKAIDDFSDLELSELHTQLELIRRRKRALQ